MDIDRLKPLFRLAALGLLAACLALPPSPALALTCNKGDANCFFVAPALSKDQKNYTIATFYSPNNATDKSGGVTVKGNLPQYVSMASGTWQAVLKNNNFLDPYSCFITTTPTGWSLAPNCTGGDANLLPACNGCPYLAPIPNIPKQISPGMVPKRYTPPPVDQITGTRRLIVKNNCADGAYALFTAPSGLTPLTRYNAKLWNRTAKENKLDPMWANAKDKTSALLFRGYLASGANASYWLPDSGIASGNMAVLLGCTGGPDPDTGWPTGCSIGSLPGQDSAGVGALFEFTAGCAANKPCAMNPSNGLPLSPAEFFDLSAVSGFNLPMSVEVRNPAAYQCSFPGAASQTTLTVASRGDLYDCPNETQATVEANATGLYVNPQLAGKGVSLQVKNPGGLGLAGCKTPDQWLQTGPNNNNMVPVTNGSGTLSITDYYACNGIPSKGADSNPDACLTPGCGGPQCAVGPKGTAGDYTPANLAKGKGKPFTNYVRYLKAVGSQAYPWAFNDNASTIVCNAAGAEVLVTFCPGPANQRPYNQQKWAYANGRCEVSATGAYPTLLACMKQNMAYGCAVDRVDKQRPDGSFVTAALPYCMPVKNGTPGAMTYARCMANNTKACWGAKAPPKK